jgi:hypothetical protein
MASIKKSTKAAVSRGRDTAVRVGKVAKSAAVAGARAGAAAAVTAGAVEAQRKWKATKPVKKLTPGGKAVLLASAAVLGVGLAIASSRRKK